MSLRCQGREQITTQAVCSSLQTLHVCRRYTQLVCGLFGSGARTDCPHCECLPLRTLRSRKALFSEGSFTSVPSGAGPAVAEVERRRRSWGSQLDLMEELETSKSLSPSSFIRSGDRFPRSEARLADTSPRAAGSPFLLSSSEEVDVVSAEYVSPSLSPQYEELVEVVTRCCGQIKS